LILLICYICIFYILFGAKRYSAQIFNIRTTFTHFLSHTDFGGSPCDLETNDLASPL